MRRRFTRSSTTTFFFSLPAERPPKQFMQIASFVGRRVFIVSAMALLAASAVAAENPFIGRWALTIPGGGAGWLGVVETNGELKGSLLWGGGSVLPVSSRSEEHTSELPSR